MQRLVKFRKFSLLFPWIKRLGLHCIAFSFFLSNFSCESSKQKSLIAKEDREVVDTFLRYVTISELGAYTILGSKPITQFSVPQTQSPEDLKAQFEAMPKDFRRKVPFKKFDTTKEIEELREICKKWMKIQYRYMGDHFAIHFNETISSGFIINIPLATYVLREYYHEFSSALGIEFDPSTASREIGDSSSNFWRTFEKDGTAFLWGLLFGYGEKNSKLFQWEKEKSISFPFRVASYHSPWLNKKHSHESALGEKIEDLDIPQFVIYQPVDEMVGKYLSEKERIIQIYKNRDFAETTVAFLRGEAVHQLSKRKNPH